MRDAEHVAARYRELAAREARRSPPYAEWAAGVAGDDQILSRAGASGARPGAPAAGGHGAGMRPL